MAKTVLKMVLGVLILALLFFSALQVWEKKSAKSPELATGTKPGEAKKIHEVSVLPSSEGAVIQISEVAGPGYQIDPVDSPKGFMLDIPSTQIALTKNMIWQPHPLIQMIEASQVFEQQTSNARLRVQFTGDATFRDRLVGSTLYIDILSEKPSDPPTTAISEAPSFEPPEVKKPRPRKKIARKPSRRRIAKRPKKTPTPVEESDDFLQGLGVDEPETATAEPQFDEPPAPTPPPEEETEEPLDVAELFSESQTGGEALPFEEEASEPSKVAVAPPQAEKFDVESVTANLPALQGLDVRNEGGVTTVFIQREARVKHKIFRLRKPARVVVEFLNAKNNLQPSYGGFPGTKVQKVESRQFVGPQGTISRVTFYVDGKEPQYQRGDNSGQEFILKIP